MIEAKTIDVKEEKELLEEWFATVAFDKPSEGIPKLDDEPDDEESRHLTHNQKDHAGGRGTASGLSDSKAAELAERVKTPDGGFTVNPRTGQDVKQGYAVAIYPDRSRELPAAKVTGDTIKDYADSNSDLLKQDGNMMGGWHDPDSGNVWLDVSRVTDNKDAAISLAKKKNQIAIFDLGSGSSINTGGTGRNYNLATTEFNDLLAELRKRDPDNPF